MKGIEGYGRYNDDPGHVGCPRAKSDMTPCVARDGAIAVADDGVCVGCGENPADLLKALVHAITTPLVAELAAMAARYGWKLVADPGRPVQPIHEQVAARILSVVAVSSPKDATPHA